MILAQINLGDWVVNHLLQLGGEVQRIKLIKIPGRSWRPLINTNINWGGSLGTTKEVDIVYVYINNK